MKRRILGVLVAVLLLLAVRSSVAEDITLTTYYPAPSGEYDVQHVNRLGVGSADDPDVLGLVDGQAIIATQGGYSGDPLLEVGSSTHSGTAIEASSSGTAILAIGKISATSEAITGVTISGEGQCCGVFGRTPLDATCASTSGMRIGVAGTGADIGVDATAREFYAVRAVLNSSYTGAGAASTKRSAVYADATNAGSISTYGSYAIYGIGGEAETCHLEAGATTPKVLGINASSINTTGIRISGAGVGISISGATAGINVGVATGGYAAHFGGNVTATGTISTTATDLAEYFATEPCEAGDVMVIDRNADKKLIKSIQPYDYRVVGVVSENPGFVLGKEGENKKLVALLGQVECKATTENGQIIPGDLLVSSSKVGHLMKGDINKIKPGMIIGKALEGLEEGEGKILVLVDGR